MKICPHCGLEMFETGNNIEHVNGTVSVEYGCDCGHREELIFVSDNPPVDRVDVFDQDEEQDA